ncbi:MAG: CRISPR-associated protein Cas4 [candidate division WOR-3 bacterium]
MFQEKFFNESLHNPFISATLTVSDVIEFCFCKRFIFFMYSLGIPQREEKLYKVQRGRELHAIREKQNINYLRRKLGVKKKEIGVFLISQSLGLSGTVDEVLHLSDGTLAPLDYKFAEFNRVLFKTHRVQSTLYAIMIQENYDKKVTRGYIVYTRSHNLLREIVYTENDFKLALSIINEIKEVIKTGLFPEGTRYKSKCRDCTYRKICI